MNRTSLIRSVLAGLALVGFTAALAPATAEAEPLTATPELPEGAEEEDEPPAS